MDKDIICCLLGAFIVSFFILFGLYFLSEKTCKETIEKQGYEYFFSVYTGCMIKSENKWIDYQKYRVLE